MPGLLAATTLLIGSTTHASVVIVSDSFTGGADGASIVGRTPDVANLPGNTWVKMGGRDVTALFTTTSAGFGDPTPGVAGNHQNNAGILIASAGSYVKPPILTISADIAPRSTVGPAADGRGIGLGFFTQTGGQFSQNYFTGLVLDASGNLNLVSDPNGTGFFASGATLGTPIAFDGTWDANQLRRLSFEVNTTTGAISNISLAGSSATYAFTTTLFTNAATTYAGAYTSSDSLSTFAAMDNFSVVGIPEPGAALLGSLGVLLLLRRRR